MQGCHTPKTFTWDILEFYLGHFELYLGHFASTRKLSKMTIFAQPIEKKKLFGQKPFFFSLQVYLNKGRELLYD